MKGVKRFGRQHPRLGAFFGLSVAMVAVLIIAARDVPLEPGQRAALITSTVLLAAACVWIIHLE